MSQIFNQLEPTQIDMIKGDTFEFVATFDDLAADLSAAAFTVKPLNSDTAAISKTLANGGVTKIATGKYDFKVAPADTASVSPGRYAYDCQVTTSDSNVYTIMYGMITVIKDIT